jgi:hypothetical protein
MPRGRQTTPTRAAMIVLARQLLDVVSAGHVQEVKIPTTLDRDWTPDACKRLRLSYRKDGDKYVVVRKPTPAPARPAPDASVEHEDLLDILP